MKRLWLFFLGCAVLCLRGSSHAQSGNSLVASVIAGGGASGGPNAPGATIGQWDAVTPSADRVNQASGFWNVEPLPELRLQRTSGLLTIAWPASFAGFRLEQSAMVGTAAVWASVPQPVTTANGENQVILTIGPDSRFFRLRLP